MKKKAQTLIIILWILLALTVVTVGIGRQVSTALYLSRYQRDRFKALYLAKAGVNRVIAELEKDANNYDSLDESWANNLDAFQKIMFGDTPNDFATVSYIAKVNGKDEIKYGVIDEERKININIALPKLLVALLKECKECGLGDTEIGEIVNHIRVWRGDQSADVKLDKYYYDNFKKAPLVNLEELLVVLEYFFQGKGNRDYQERAQELYKNIRGLITVYTINATSQLNVNTVSEEALSILANSVAENSEHENSVSKVVREIIGLREDPSKGPFKKIEDIKIDVVAGSADESLFNNLKPNLTVFSHNFRIEVTGNIGKINNRITAIYNRENKKIPYWHES